MYEQVEKPKDNSYPTNTQESRAHANSVIKSNVKQGVGFVDNRPEAIAQRRLINTNLISNVLTAQLDKPIGNKNDSLDDTIAQKNALVYGTSRNIIQKYSYKSLGGAEITAQFPNNDTRKWIESIGAEVTWNKGETMDPNGIGTHDVHNHGWVGVLKNQSNNNNATGLHMVNAQWGGSADALKGNLVPGTPSLNGHHKSIENKVHNQFKNNGGKAPDNMSYRADVWTDYPQTINYKNKKSGEEFPYKDATITCNVIVGTKKEVDNENVKLGGGIKVVVP